MFKKNSWWCTRRRQGSSFVSRVAHMVLRILRRARGVVNRTKELRSGTRTVLKMSSMAEGLKGGCKCCVGGAHKGVTESLDEMDFQWSLAGAAQAGDVGRMRGLLALATKVDGDGDSGYLCTTPPGMAMSKLAFSSIRCRITTSHFVQSGAQVGRRTRAGQATSLHRAAYAGHIEVVKVLLQHGATVGAQDSDGQTCLRKASMQGHAAVVKLLKEVCPEACSILDNQVRSALP